MKLQRKSIRLYMYTTEMADATMAHLNGEVNACIRSKRQFCVRFQQWSRRITEAKENSQWQR